MLTSHGVSVRVVLIDTTPLIAKYRADSISYPDIQAQDYKAQLEWLDKTPAEAKEDWAIGHHLVVGIVVLSGACNCKLLFVNCQLLIAS